MNVTKARTILYARSGYVCEMCARARAVEAHHRKNRSQGGEWSPENLLHLCSKCHAHVGRYRTVAFEQGWAVKRNFDPATEPVWIAGRGRVLLDADGGVTPVTEGEHGMAEFKQYRRSQIAEMADWTPGFDMTDVSVSAADRDAGSPKPGDKIARNPKNHADKWLVAAAYAADNFEPMEDAA